MSVEVTAADIEQAKSIQQIIAKQLGNAGFVVYDFVKPDQSSPLAQAFAAHRRKAEHAMRERCAEIAERYPSNESYVVPIVRGVAHAIRSMEAPHER